MISATAKYALRSVAFLASHQNGFSNRAEIAKATFVPHDYLLKVLNELDAAGIVESKRGPGGGYRLTVESDELTVLRVVLAVDEVPRVTECPLGIVGHESLCPLHRMLDEAGRLVEETFRNTLISDLVPKRRGTKACQFPKKASGKTSG